MRVGPLLGSGRTADVYALGDDRVLRRYRNGMDATGEAAVMAYLGDHGYPVPHVWPAGDGPDTDPAARSDLVMERLTGPTMLHALLDGAMTSDRAGRMLADLLHRLHAIPARLSTDPAHRLRHLDLHPDNVLLTPRGPVVIDWANTSEGQPGLDWALSALILAEVGAGGFHPDAAPAARDVLRVLLTHSHRVDLGDGRTGPLAAAREIRTANPTLGHDEKARVDDAVALVLATTRT